MSEKSTYFVSGWVSKPVDTKVEAESAEKATEIGREQLELETDFGDVEITYAEKQDDN